MNHEIFELSFGDPMYGANLPANFSPLKGKNTKDKDPMSSHDYTLKIVPTVYQDIRKKTRFGYQFTAVYKGKKYRVFCTKYCIILFRFCCLRTRTSCYARYLVPLRSFTHYCKIYGKEQTPLSLFNNFLCYYWWNIYCRRHD